MGFNSAIVSVVVDGRVLCLFVFLEVMWPDSDTKRLVMSQCLSAYLETIRIDQVATQPP